MSVLLVELQLYFAAALADRCVVLGRSAVVAQGLGPDVRHDGLERFPFRLNTQPPGNTP